MSYGTVLGELCLCISSDRIEKKLPKLIRGSTEYNNHNHVLNTFRVIALVWVHLIVQSIRESCEVLDIDRNH